MAFSWWRDGAIRKAKLQHQRTFTLAAYTILTAAAVLLISQIFYKKIQKPFEINIVAVSIHALAGFLGFIGVLRGSLLYDNLLKGRKFLLETHLILEEWRHSNIKSMIDVLYDYAKISHHITAVTFDATVRNLLCAEALMYISMITTFCNSANILFVHTSVPQILDSYVDSNNTQVNSNNSQVNNNNGWYRILSYACITFSLISIAVILIIMIIVHYNERMDKRKCIVSMLNIAIPIGTNIVIDIPKCRETVLLAVDTAIEEAVGHNTKEIRDNIGTTTKRLSGKIRMINFKKYVENNKYYWRPLYDSKLLRTNEIEYANRHRYLATRAVNACCIKDDMFSITEDSDVFITSQLLKSDASIKHTGLPVFNKASCQSIANADNDAKNLLRYLSELRKSRAALKNKLGAHKSIIWYLNAFVLVAILWACNNHESLNNAVIDVIMGIVVTFITAAWPPMINDVFYMFNHWNASKNVEITCWELNKKYGFKNLEKTCNKLLNSNNKWSKYDVQNKKIEEHDWHQLRIVDNLSTVIVLKSLCNKYLESTNSCNLKDSYCRQCLWILEKYNNCVRIRRCNEDAYLSHDDTFALTVCKFASCEKSSLWQLHYVRDDKISEYMLFNDSSNRYLGYDNDGNITLQKFCKATRSSQKWTIAEVYDDSKKPLVQQEIHRSQYNVIRFNSSEFFNIIEVSQDEDNLAQAMRVFMT